MHIFLQIISEGDLLKRVLFEFVLNMQLMVCNIELRSEGDIWLMVNEKYHQADSFSVVQRMKVIAA